jgi:S1-C subfamily serine protease
MKYLKALSLPLLAAVLAFPASSVKAEEGFQKCEKSFQVCIDELVAQMRERGWLGILDLGMNDNGQFVIRNLAAEGPAAMGGFEEGDILVTFNGKKIRSYQDLLNYHQSLKAGQIVQYTVLRGEEEMEIDVLLREGVADVISGWIGDYIMTHYVKVENDKVILD